MKRNVLAAIASVTVVAALLAGCGGSQSATDDRLTIALNEPIDSWNPQKALNTVSYTVFPQVFASLLTTPPDGGEPEPGLATSYEFDDAAKTITFHLDPDAKFSDGTDVTADDVVYSEGLWASGEIYGSFFDSIKQAKAVDEDTVRFILNRPDHALLGILASAGAAVVPEDLGGVDEKAFWKEPVSAGPYRIVDEEVDQSITLKKNEYYSGAPDRPAEVEYVVVSDAAQQQLQFQSGQVDVVADVQLDVSSQYPQDRLETAASSRVATLMLQTEAKPFDDPDFRKAITLAIDHESLISGGFAGLADQATGILPQIIPGVGTCDGCDWSETDLPRARQLIAASDYDGQPLTLLIASGPGPEKLAAEAIVPMLAKVGIEVSLKALPLSAYLDKVASGNYELATISYNALAPTPIDPLGFLASTDILFSRASTKPARKALDAVTRATTTEEMEAVTARFEQWAYDTVAVIPLAVPNMIDAVSERVENFPTNSYQAWSVSEVTLDEQ